MLYDKILSNHGMTAVSLLTTGLEQWLPEPQAGLVAAMTYGVQDALDATVKQQMITTGTIHIAVLSGMNISILSHVVVRIVAPRFGARIASLLSICITIGFIALVGVTAPLARAGIMAVLSSVSVVLGRRYNPTIALLVSAIAMILLNPSIAIDLSFLLSFFATLGILLFGKVLAYPSLVAACTARLPTPLAIFVRSLYADIHLSLAASVFTTPLIMVAFHRVSVIAVIANILIDWSVLPILILSMCTSFFSFITPFAALPFCYVLYLLSSYILAVVATLSTVPFASISW